jgi:phosphotransferase system enzyme I (PtsP)
MAPASVGPVKSMILSLDAGELQRWLRATIRTAEGNVRSQLKRYAEEHGVEI